MIMCRATTQVTGGALNMRTQVIHNDTVGIQNAATERPYDGGIFASKITQTARS